MLDPAVETPVEALARFEKAVQDESLALGAHEAMVTATGFTVAAQTCSAVASEDPATLQLTQWLRVSTQSDRL